MKNRDTDKIKRLYDRIAPIYDILSMENIEKVASWKERLWEKVKHCRMLIDEELAGSIAVADIVKVGSAATVKTLHQMRVNSVGTVIGSVLSLILAME
ncbi:hypothetical protein U472_10100 [Orenia metallireducens]|uniref:Uncharacterized protein n=1 Tax=Orenia metallireducens TaxID=1413210 RepID=A0A1C0A805_9FIRM|nr:hypothetical protein [Orenia metallireducens]OCL26350.1 hypothetical protein U472_10100 [Orenia metallireducens]